jgi:hypothetical protein
LHTEKEEDEAHLMVPSERRGELGSGGAMVRMVVAVFLRLFTERKRGRWGEEEIVAAARGRRTRV